MALPMQMPTSGKKYTTNSPSIEILDSQVEKATSCAPFVVFVVLAVISTIIYLIIAATSRKADVSQVIVYLLFHIIFYILFGWLIYYLCKKGHQGWAWFLVLLPLILSSIFVIAIFGLALGYAAGETIAGQND